MGKELPETCWANLKISKLLLLHLVGPLLYLCRRCTVKHTSIFLSISSFVLFLIFTFLRLFDSHSQTVAVLVYFFIIYSSLFLLSFLPACLWVFLSLDILVFPFVSCLFSSLSHCMSVTARHIGHCCSAVHLLVFPPHSGEQTSGQESENKSKTRLRSTLYIIPIIFTYMPMWGR